jgi:hypothetical protein
VCETERFPNLEKNFSDGAWCVERVHDRPFQDFVAHETHRLIPSFEHDAAESLMIAPECLLDVSPSQDGRFRCGHCVFDEKNL